MDSPDGTTTGAAHRRPALGPRVSRAEALARRLETEIADHALPPGERLGTKDELRRRFGVAVGTLNEAVRLMEMRGLVAARPGPGGGVFVTEVAKRGHMILGLDWERATLGDCVELRGALEPLVCRQAARHGTAEDMRELDAHVDRMEAALGDMRAYFHANWALHRRLAEICRNAPLRSVYLTLAELLEAGLDDLAWAQDDGEAIAVHRALVAAISDGEGPALEAAIERHMRRSPLPRQRSPRADA